MNNLIKAFEEYIRFLEDEINKNTTYLVVHSIYTPRDVVQRGIELRAKIAALKEKNYPMNSWLKDLEELKHFWTSRYKDCETVGQRLRIRHQFIDALAKHYGVASNEQYVLEEVNLELIDTPWG